MAILMRLLTYLSNYGHMSRIIFPFIRLQLNQSEYEHIFQSSTGSGNDGFLKNT